MDALQQGLVGAHPRVLRSDMFPRKRDEQCRRDVRPPSPDTRLERSVYRCFTALSWTSQGSFVLRNFAVSHQQVSRIATCITNGDRGKHIKSNFIHIAQSVEMTKIRTDEYFEVGRDRIYLSSIDDLYGREDVSFSW